IGALVRESVLEKLLAGKVLKIRVMDPALAHPLIGQSVNALEQQQPHHEAGLNARSAVLAVERGDLAVDPVPVELAGELNQLSSRARNRSLAPVVWCFLGRIDPSDADRESCFAPQGNPE